MVIEPVEGSHCPSGCIRAHANKSNLTRSRSANLLCSHADPPWQYENPPMGGSNRSIENHYPTMTLEQICALPVAAIAHENAVAVLWATPPKLAECIQVLDAWGFNYRTDMVGQRQDRHGLSCPRKARLSLLIAKRGELPPPAVDARPDLVQQAPRLEHSAKPTLFYEILDRMYPGVRKIELFGRRAGTARLMDPHGVIKQRPNK